MGIEEEEEEEQTKETKEGSYKFVITRMHEISTGFDDTTVTPRGKQKLGTRATFIPRRWGIRYNRRELLERSSQEVTPTTGSLNTRATKF